MKYRPILLGACCGVGALFSPLSTLIPLLFWRRVGREMMLGYGAALGVDLLAAAFDYGVSKQYLILGLLLTLWLALGWYWSTGKSPWRSALWLMGMVIPPMAVFAVGNPLAVSGWMFPGTGLIGLVSWAVVVIGLQSQQNIPTKYFIIATFSMVASNLAFACLPPQKTSDQRWQGINTEVPDVEHNFETAQLIRNAGNADLITVLPESIGADIDLFSMFYAPQIKSTIIVGGYKGSPGTGDGQAGLAVYQHGVETQWWPMRMPPPGAMWPSQFRWSLDSVGVQELNNQKVGRLICYEAFLVFPMLTNFGADTLIMVGNFRWSHFPQVWWLAELGWGRAWARLIGVKLITAANY